MKGSLLLLFLFYFGIFSGKTVKAPGYYIKKGSKDTVKTDLEIKIKKDEIDFHNMQEEVIFFDGAEKKKLDPNDISEVGFRYNSQLHRMNSILITFEIIGRSSGKSCLFLCLKQDGRIKILSFWGKIEDTNQPEHSVYRADQRYIAADYQEWRILAGETKKAFVCFDDVSFWDKIVIFFQDCPALVAKINDRTWGINQSDLMVMDYNTNCK
jgi:hypothetical protein